MTKSPKSRTPKVHHLSLGALVALAVSAAFAVPALVRSEASVPAETLTTSSPAATAAAPAPLEAPATEAAPAPAATPLSEGAPFTLHVKTDGADELVPYEVLGLFVMPSEKVAISVSDGVLGRSFDVTAAAGRVTATGETAWSFVAPDRPGVYPVRVTEAGGSRSTLLNVFVKTPFSRTEKTLNGYRIGDYPEETFRQTAEYKTPRGFVEVTAANRNTKVAPHFTVGQFLCKQAGGYPKYLMLRERLVLKLEAVLEAVHDEGIAADTLHVMSGYRTPAYNADLGNVKFSQHQFGGAADIFVDRDRNGAMDDINRDGRVDRGDTEKLVSIVERMMKNPKYARFIGGVGRYGSTGSHGPFVHVDARGYSANWG